MTGEVVADGTVIREASEDGGRGTLRPSDEQIGAAALRACNEDIVACRFAGVTLSTARPGLTKVEVCCVRGSGCLISISGLQRELKRVSASS